jgi:hypothetical protein
MTLVDICLPQDCFPIWTESSYVNYATNPSILFIVVPSFTSDYDSSRLSATNAALHLNSFEPSAQFCKSGDKVMQTPAATSNSLHRVQKSQYSH